MKKIAIIRNVKCNSNTKVEINKESMKESIVKAVYRTYKYMASNEVNLI